MTKIRGMYRCCNCDKLFDSGDVIRVEEPRGEFWGVPCTETMYYSPCCRDSFEEAYEDDEEKEE